MKKIRCEDMDWGHGVRTRDQRRDSCQHGNELQGSIKCRKFIKWLSPYKRHKTDCTLQFLVLLRKMYGVFKVNFGAVRLRLKHTQGCGSTSPHFLGAI
jgi:hypothetical protein